MAQELHSATHLGGQALWKLFSDRYAYKGGRRLCIEVAQSCLPPDLQNDACASPSLDNPTDYVEVLRQRLSLTHQQMTAPLPPASGNPHQDDSPGERKQIDS